ncbi:ABC-2 type transport system permease protein [Modestobacter sp. DSM 44400]|uniref:hypothetical protein n=1 Tax=Modestobacter sp. DSM 44400 TaxID=1550230 RepID=UPI0008944C0D|nr:hypothetical protein [Modestobacter sp. DSM 44400]SDX87351.1 ABC-2 type transport system permease protein [Modestobacter sp. DSM 44400]
MNTLARDTYTVFARAMRMSLRMPAWLVISLMQPVLYIVLFGPLLKPLTCPASWCSWASSARCSSASA